MIREIPSWEERPKGKYHFSDHVLADEQEIDPRGTEFFSKKDAWLSPFAVASGYEKRIEAVEIACEEEQTVLLRIFNPFNIEFPAFMVEIPTRRKVRLPTFLRLGPCGVASFRCLLKGKGKAELRLHGFYGRCAL